MKKSEITKDKHLFQIIDTIKKTAKKHNNFENEILSERSNLRLKNNKIKKYKIASFDIETVSDANNFYLFGMITPEGEYKYTYDKLVAIKMLNSLKNCLIYSTNLGFDFNGIVEETDFKNQCHIMMRGNSYIMVSWKNHMHKIKLLDSINYGGLSVESMGKILKLPKLRKPRCLGRHPKNGKELKELLEYNKRDCEVTKKFMELMQETVNSLGGELKLTISSCAMDIFRRRFLDSDVFKESNYINYVNIKNKIFSGYYGGRTEAFKKGLIDAMTSKCGKWYYADVNSLYPSVMLNEMPVPMSVKYIDVVAKSKFMDFLKYEGVSIFTIRVPYTKYPLLPYRMKTKLIFPYGLMKNVSLTHLEVRRQLELYPDTEIIEMKECVYYTKKKAYFKRYVETLYSLRQKFKAEHNEMEVCVKLLLNSLYGRFALRNIDRVEFIVFDDYEKAREKVIECEKKGIRVKVNSGMEMYYNEKEEFDGISSYPIWSVYTTAFARIRLHEFLEKYKPVYCDTDSVITDIEVKNSSVLGELKVEKMIKYGVIIKPKLYILDDEIKSKGVPIPKSTREKIRLMRKILNGEEIKYKKFVKVKEGISQDIKVNSIVIASKKICLEDNKRRWNCKFDKSILQDSEPLEVRDE